MSATANVNWGTSVDFVSSRKVNAVQAPVTPKSAAWTNQRATPATSAVLVPMATSAMGRNVEVVS